MHSGTQHETSSTGDSRPWAFATVAGSAVMAVWSYLSWPYVEDDGFIHLEYARNVARGAGFTFDGHAVFADSSPLWVAMLSLAGRASGDWVLAAKLVSIAAFAVASLGAAELCRKLFGDARVAAAMTALVMLSPFPLYWSTAGMETCLGLGACLWMLSLAFATPTLRPGTLLATFAAVGFVPLLRFETALLVALLGVWTLAVRRPLGARGFGLLLLCGILAAAPTLAWMGYAHEVLGSAVPTTSAAKRVAQSFDLSTLSRTVVKAVSTVGFGFAPLWVGSLWVGWRAWRGLRGQMSIRAALLHWQDARWLLLLWPLVLWLFYLLNRTNLQTRYALLLGAPLLIGLGVTAARVVGPGFDALRTPLLVAGALMLVQNLSLTLPHMLRKAQATRDWDAQLVKIGDCLPADVPVAIYSIGQFAFRLPNPVVDTGALVMPGALAYQNDPEAMRRWVMRQGAQCLVAGPEPPEGFQRVLAGSGPNPEWFPGPSQAHGLHCLPDVPLAPHCRP